jgi:hypothetical protein
VLEPEDTSKRTRNLQQTTTSGHRIQEVGERLREAERVVASWPAELHRYSPHLMAAMQFSP